METAYRGAHEHLYIKMPDRQMEHSPRSQKGKQEEASRERSHERKEAERKIMKKGNNKIQEITT
ncbi:hypothetical protein [Desulfoluna butyratoxydans]|uniref:hypothetical protein n=1 Tax=Desulfoluna butyratoxydans TaxID=231438 RepID=UPI0015D0E0D5|nr:hypothetical protein [Desulfoluna butyratoxydans]